MNRRSLLTLVFVMLVVGALSYIIFAPPPGSRTPESLRRFSPTRVAELETRMWQAYYDNDRIALFANLVMTMREQYRFSWSVATRGVVRVC